MLLLMVTFWHERPELIAKVRAASAAGFVPAAWSMYV